MHFRRWIKYILVSLFLLSHTKSIISYRSERHIDSPRGCSFMKCKKNEKCVNRKFSCEYYPCPSMLYCAKSRTELLKGPQSCESVRCTRGYVCVITTRHCTWNETCRERYARCVTEQQYYDSPASCAGFNCPSGQRCILRESLCPQVPCKLFKSCAKTQDVHVWMDRCKSLGCLSEYQCFLRRPSDNCRGSNCQHSPDCTATRENELLTSEKCSGWICPRGQQCTYQVQSPCTNDNCRILRSCYGQLIHMNDSSSVLNAHYHSSKPLLRFFTPSARPPDNFPWTSSELPSSPWLDHFRLRNNAQAVKYLLQEAQQDPNYNHTKFHQWLNSVKDILGQKAYNLWLEEVRTITVNNKRFHELFQSSRQYLNSSNKIAQSSQPFWNLLLGKNDESSSRELISAKTPLFRFDNQSEMAFDMNQQQVLVNLLHKLREERQAYLRVINKTKELVSSVGQLLPDSQLDRIIEELKRPSDSSNYTHGSNGTLISETDANLRIGGEGFNDYSDSNDTDFLLVDYGESSQIDINETVPRVIISVENNMRQPIRIGNIHLKYDDEESHENLTQSVYDQDYYVDEFQYFRPVTTNGSTKTNKYL